jgi:hypothetical protein
MRIKKRFSVICVLAVLVAVAGALAIRNSVRHTGSWQSNWPNCRLRDLQGAADREYAECSRLEIELFDQETAELDAAGADTAKCDAIRAKFAQRSAELSDRSEVLEFTRAFISERLEK